MDLSPRQCVKPKWMSVYNYYQYDEPFRDFWMHAPAYREEIKCDQGSYVVKWKGYAWFWDCKDLGLNSPSPLVNHLISGQLLSRMVPQVLHHRTRLTVPVSVLLWLCCIVKHLASGLGKIHPIFVLDLLLHGTHSGQVLSNRGLVSLSERALRRWILGSLCKGHTLWGKLRVRCQKEKAAR